MSELTSSIHHLYLHLSRPCQYCSRSSSRALLPQHIANMANSSGWQERKNASQAVLTPPSKFTLDTILHALNKTVARPGLSLILIPALAKYYDSRQPSATGNLPFLEQVRELLFKKYKWAGRLFIFSLLRIFHSAATRYVKNNGEWRADKPNWRRDVTVVTGGSGRSILHLLGPRNLKG